MNSFGNLFGTNVTYTETQLDGVNVERVNKTFEHFVGVVRMNGLVEVQK